VTILLDEKIEGIINRITEEDEALKLNTYNYSDDYMKKLGVISDAITRGFVGIFEYLSNKKHEAEVKTVSDRQELKSRFKVISGGR
jgi:hypothetical protein